MGQALGALHDALPTFYSLSWEHIVRRAQRLAYLRRLWSALGSWLKEVKQRGRNSCEEP